MSSGDFHHHLVEVSTSGIQSCLKQLKPTEYALLVQKYRDTLTQYQANSTTKPEKKLLEQLIFSIPTVLLLDTKLQKILGDDEHAAFVYNVRTEMLNLLEMVESKYDTD